MGDSSRLTRTSSKQTGHMCNKSPTADRRISMHSLPALWSDALQENEGDLDESACVCSRLFGRDDYRVKDGKHELQLHSSAVPRYHLDSQQRVMESTHRRATYLEKNLRPNGEVFEALRQLRKVTSKLEDELRHPVCSIPAKHPLSPDQSRKDKEKQSNAQLEQTKRPHSSDDAMCHEKSLHELKKPSDHCETPVPEICSQSPKRRGRPRKTGVAAENPKKGVTIQSLRQKICQLQKTIKNLRYKRRH